MSQTFVRSSLAAVTGLLLVFGMSAPSPAEIADKQEQNLEKKKQLRDLEKAYDQPVKERKKTSKPKLQDLNVDKKLDKSSP